jgi:hypothetical protein
MKRIASDMCNVEKEMWMTVDICTHHGGEMKIYVWFVMSESNLLS